MSRELGSLHAGSFSQSAFGKRQAGWVPDTGAKSASLVEGPTLPFTSFTKHAVIPVARREHISANFNKWWLLPFSILTASALTALNILVFGPSFIQQTGSYQAIDCSGPKANDFSCYQKRYEDLVYNSGV